MGNLRPRELYDPATGVWSATGSLLPNIDHSGEPTLTLLPNGKVLAIGGQTTPPADAELYDPASGSWVSANYGGPRRVIGHTASL